MKTSREFTQVDSWNQFIQEGKEEALSVVYAENYDLLFDYGHKFTNNIHIIEDAIQDMFINIIKYRKSIGVVKNIPGYLICAFRRQLFLDLNKQKKNVSTEQLSDGFFDYLSSPNSDVNEKEEQEFLHSVIANCVNDLTDKQKEILYLRFEREISYEEISTILQISVESCYKSIYRSIKTLKLKAENALNKAHNWGSTTEQASDIKRKSAGH